MAVPLQRPVEALLSKWAWEGVRCEEAAAGCCSQGWGSRVLLPWRGFMFSAQEAGLTGPRDTRGRAVFSP